LVFTDEELKVLKAAELYAPKKDILETIAIMRKTVQTSRLPKKNEGLKEFINDFTIATRKTILSANKA